MTGKLKRFGFGLAIAAAVIGLVVAFPVAYGASEISSVVVDAWVPKDGGGVLLIHYEPAKNGVGGSEALTDKVMSGTDVRKIKGALCKTRVLYGFYSDGIVTIQSPNPGLGGFLAAEDDCADFSGEGGSGLEGGGCEAGKRSSRRHQQEHLEPDFGCG